MSSAELLTTLRNRGVVLSASRGQLDVDAPEGELSDEDFAALREHKADLIRILDPPLIGPYRTPWSTLCWTSPGAPPIEAFGPPPPMPQQDSTETER